ncbi:MAG: hypothetical protein AAFN77_24340 [Planctomycetota bacterium]
MTTRSKRWLTLSLRGALVVVTISAVTLGIIANRASRQLKTLAAIRTVGGDYRLHRDSEGMVARFLDGWFGEEAFAEITKVNLRATEASDDYWLESIA